MVKIGDYQPDTVPEQIVEHPLTLQGQSISGVSGVILEKITPDHHELIKDLFEKLHRFNAALDPRFALSKNWEIYFETLLGEIYQAEKYAGFIALTDKGNRKEMEGIGFIIGAVHQEYGLWEYRDWVEVMALYLEPAWRGKGLAPTMLQRVYDWAESSGFPTIQLYVTASNSRAIRFYQKEDFQPAQMILRKNLKSQ